MDALKTIEEVLDLLGPPAKYLEEVSRKNRSLDSFINEDPERKKKKKKK